MVNNWLKRMQQHLYAAPCILCQSSKTNSFNLCDACQQDLPWLTNGCRTCALPLVVPKENPDWQPVCGHCLRITPPFRQCHCLFTYDYPIDRLVTRLKFNQKPAYGRTFGKLLAAYIQRHYSPADYPDAVVPVPLHSSRFRERGFNQAYEIARSCAKDLGVPLLPQVCERIKATDHQLGLTAAIRRKNLRNAFRITLENESESAQKLKSIALIDDVMTTGATLTELSRAFLKAGIAEVHVWCIARTVFH